jgi:hypothetical protein
MSREPRAEPSLVWTLAALASVLAASVLLGYRPIYSFDVGFYMDIGRSIAETGRVPFEDQLTFTRAGTEVRFYPWLFCLVSWWLYQLGGTLLLVGGKIVGTLACMILLLVRAWRRSGRIGLPSVVLLLAFSVGSFWEYRPHIASWTLLTVVLLVLEEYDRGNSRWLWSLPFVLALWVNLHSLFILGLIAIAIHIVGGWIAGRRPDRKLLAAGLVSGLACFLTPYARTVAWFPVEQFLILRHSIIKSDVVGTAEFLSPFRLDFFDVAGRWVLWQPMAFVMLYAALVLIAGAFGRRRYSPTDWLLLLAFGYIFYQAVKNYGYFVVATFPAAAEGLARAGGSLDRALARWLPARAAGRTREAAATVVALLSLVLCAQIINGYWYGLQRAPHKLGHGFDASVLPVRASAFIDEHLHTPLRILNNWDAGGFLRFATRWPVFIDGRNEVMGEPFYREYLEFKDPRTLPAKLKQWRIESALVPYNDLPVWFHYLEQSVDWRWVYRDDRHALFVRADRSAGLAPLPRPQAGTDYPSIPDERVDTILAEAARLHRPWGLATVFRRHYEPRVELSWSLLYLRSGHPRAAIGYGLAGLERSTFPAPEIFATLGHAFFDLHEFERAERCFTVALRQVDDPLAKRRLDALRRSTRAPAGGSDRTS